MTQKESVRVLFFSWSDLLFQNLGVHRFELPVHAEFHFARFGGSDVVVHDLAVLPLDIDGAISPRHEARGFAGRPGLGQRREELDFARVRLHQHLANTGGVAEVAVDLKRRVRVEEVAIQAAAFHRRL